MRNITVTVTDDTYRHARLWAAQNNTTVSSSVNYMLENVHRILRVHKPPPHVRHNTKPKRNDIAAGEAVEQLLKDLERATS